MDEVTQQRLESLNQVYEAISEAINNEINMLQQKEEYLNQLEDLRNHVQRLIEAYGGSVPEGAAAASSAKAAE